MSAALSSVDAMTATATASWWTLCEAGAGLQRDRVVVDVAAAGLSGSDDDDFAAAACALLPQSSSGPAAGGAGGSVAIGPRDALEPVLKQARTGWCSPTTLLRLRLAGSAEHGGNARAG